MDLVLYHGTPYAFERFRSDRGGIHFGTFDQAVDACTRQLGRMPLDVFAFLPPDCSGYLGRILKCHLRIDNPLRCEDPRTPARWRRLIEQARQRGHDAIVYRNVWEQRDRPHDSICLFDPTQVMRIERVYEDQGLQLPALP